jgi:hypothetical protein
MAEKYILHVKVLFATIDDSKVVREAEAEQYVSKYS